MTKQEAIDELRKHYVPEYVNYIVTALTDGATPSDAPTINAIPIPKDATNGDVQKALHPKNEVKPYKKMTVEREIVQALPSLYPLTETEENAVIYITTKQVVEFVEEGCEDRAELYPICPNCKKDLNSEKWDFCPYCGIPLEWESKET